MGMIHCARCGTPMVFDVVSAARTEARPRCEACLDRDADELREILREQKMALDSGPVRGLEDRYADR